MYFSWCATQQVFWISVILVSLRLLLYFLLMFRFSICILSLSNLFVFVWVSEWVSECVCVCVCVCIYTVAYREVSVRAFSKQL